MTAPTATAPPARGLAAALPAWASGIVTGALAAAASLLVMVAPTLATLASAPHSGDSTDWGTGAAVATRLWLLGLGVPMETSAATFSLVPLGLTVLIVAILVATAQRFLLSSWSAVALAILSFATLVGFAASLASSGTGASSSVTTRAVLGALLVAVPGIVAGRVRAHGLTIDVVERVPVPIRAGIRAAVAALALMVLVGAAAGAIAAVQGASRMADAVTRLDADPVGAAVLALGQLLYLPTLVLWMVAWLSGVGFGMGAGTIYSPTEVIVGDLPDLPLLGALPLGTGGMLAWTPLLLVVIGAVVRAALRGRVRSWRGEIAMLGASGLVLAVAVGFLMALASGSAGPGRLEDVGPAAVPVTGAIVGLVLAGQVAIAVIAAARRRARGRNRAREGRSQSVDGSSTP